jgi:hypothetical protein
MYRAKVQAGEMTEAEAEAILGKSVWEAQGKLPKMWPTPTNHGENTGTKIEAHRRRMDNGLKYSSRISQAIAIADPSATGYLNPTWVEWLMGFPLGWTDLEDSETQSSHKLPNTSDE